MSVESMQERSDHRSWVADPDPGSGAFLTPDPGSGLQKFLPDPGSQTYISESLMTIFG